MTTVAELKVGDRARVVSFGRGDRTYRERLLAMGLTPGAEFSVSRLAPLGDPVEITVRGCAVSLRKDEAELLQVETVVA